MSILRLAAVLLLLVGGVSARMPCLPTVPRMRLVQRESYFQGQQPAHRSQRLFREAMRAGLLVTPALRPADGLGYLYAWRPVIRLGVCG